MILLWLACVTNNSVDVPPAEASAPPSAFKLTEVAKIPVVTAIVAPDKEDALYMTEEAGRIWRLNTPQPVLDISGQITAGGEMGLLGLAFHPNFPTDPRHVVNYTRYEGKQLRSHISSFRMQNGQVDPKSEVEVLSFDQPWENHNSGALAFGPDGYLYAAVGDGGAGGDPRKTGQNRADWLGSILRVDISVPPYQVPADNPFVGQAGVKPEIWAYGVRNPWGMHFDGQTLWFADVGQDSYEEINRGVKGGNYGWNVMEASHCFKDAPCDPSPFIAPVAEYSHQEGQSVTGGLVYRGPSIPVLNGRYVYADYVGGKLWTLDPAGGAPTLIGSLGINPSAFGSDHQQRLYVAAAAGKVFRIDPI